MDEISTVAPTYPMLRLVVRYGNPASTAIGVVLALAGVAAGLAAGSVLVTVGAVVGAAAAFVVLRILVEMVGLVTDMLLPK